MRIPATSLPETTLSMAEFPEDPSANANPAWLGMVASPRAFKPTQFPWATLPLVLA